LKKERKITFLLEKLMARVIRGTAESTRFDFHGIARLFAEKILTRTASFFAVQVTR
jgi:hypothetical protein